MKKISVVVPCYNDEGSIHEMAERLRAVFRGLAEYDYEIIFSDDSSPDGTWEKIRAECAADPKVKGIHNITNFGAPRNIFQALQYGDGDACFLLMGDLQQPPEHLPEFIRYWEEGFHCVVGSFGNTEEKGLSSLGRKIFYQFMERFSGKKMIPNFSFFGLYDKSLIGILSRIRNVQPYFPGIVAEYGGKLKTLQVRQQESRRGRSNQGFFKRYDYAMVGITSNTKLLMRMATVMGCLVGFAALVFSVVVFALKLMNWETYPMGIPSVLIGVFFLGAVQLFFLGIMGEYILSINERSMERPLTLADQKINFGGADDEDGHHGGDGACR